MFGKKRKFIRRHTKRLVYTIYSSSNGMISQTYLRTSILFGGDWFGRSAVIDDLFSWFAGMHKGHNDAMFLDW